MCSEKRSKTGAIMISGAEARRIVLRGEGFGKADMDVLLEEEVEEDPCEDDIEG